MSRRFNVNNEYVDWEINAPFVLKVLWHSVYFSATIGISNVILAMAIKAIGFSMMPTLAGVALLSAVGVAILLPPLYLMHDSLYSINETNGLNPLGYLVFGLVNMAILALPVLATVAGSAALGLDLIPAFLEAIVICNAPSFLWNTIKAAFWFIWDQSDPSIDDAPVDVTARMF